MRPRPPCAIRSCLAPFHTPFRMLHTSELRRFLPESEIDSFPTLFPKSSPGDPLVRREARLDTYRVVPGASIIGLKVRGYRSLELKTLRVAPVPFRWTTRDPADSPCVVLGQADSWVK